MMDMTGIYLIGVAVTLISVIAFYFFSPNPSPNARIDDDIEALTGCVIHIVIITFWPIALPIILFFIAKNCIKSYNG